MSVHLILNQYSYNIHFFLFKSRGEWVIPKYVLNSTGPQMHIIY